MKEKMLNILFAISFNYIADNGEVRIILDDIMDFWFNNKEFGFRRYCDGDYRIYDSSKIKNLKITQ